MKYWYIGVVNNNYLNDFGLKIHDKVRLNSIYNKKILEAQITESLKKK